MKKALVVLGASMSSRRRVRAAARSIAFAGRTADREADRPKWARYARAAPP